MRFNGIIILGIILGIAILLVIETAIYKNYSSNKLSQKVVSQKNIQKITKMKLISPAFESGKKIPAKYTCDGDNINPPLQIKEVPKEAKSLVLIMDDPDAPSNTWIHWTVWNINPKTAEILENNVPQGAIEGITSFGDIGYGGPCPPSGTHRYFFKLFALDAYLELKPGASLQDLKSKMGNHILAKTELIRLYNRK
jgi:Raf kinase inhibitor-like YbhB/YbcL family protein